MKTRSIYTYSLVVALMAGSMTISRADEPADSLPCQAIVTAFKGAVSLTRGDKPRYLKKQDLGQRLVTGDVIACESGGQVTLTTLRGVVQRHFHQAPYPVPHVTIDSNDPAAVAFENYGRVGARTRGSGSLAIRPDSSFTIRWSVRDFGTAVTCSIDCNDGNVWSSGIVHSKAGTYQVSGVAAAITSAHDSGRFGPYDLTVSNASGKSERLEVELLSPAKLAALNKGLAAAGHSSDPLALHITKGAAYEEANLPAEAKREYQAALKLAPQSESLHKWIKADAAKSTFSASGTGAAARSGK